MSHFTLDALPPQPAVAPMRSARLLDLDPDLGSDLGAEQFQQARAAVVVPLLELRPADWDLEALAADAVVRGTLLGLFIIDGLVARELLLLDQRSTQLHGPGEIIALSRGERTSLPVTTRLAVPDGARVAILDDRVLAATQRWPRLGARLFQQAILQFERAAAHQAISQLPRVEDRLVAMFWHLADRWGRVCPDGVLIDLTLTHAALGRLVGARRPTVSLGLQLLDERGTVSRRPDGRWLIASGLGEPALTAPTVEGGAGALERSVPGSKATSDAWHEPRAETSRA